MIEIQNTGSLFYLSQNEHEAVVWASWTMRSRCGLFSIRYWMTTDLWLSWDIRASEEAHPDICSVYIDTK